MLRKLRVQYAGAIYHLMNRGIAGRTFLKMNRSMFGSWKRWEKLVRRLVGKFMPGV